MTKEKALNLLGLSEYYTERDLITNYRKLAKKYHPDKLGNNVTKKNEYEEKMKEINVAKDLLDHLLKSKNNNSNHNNENMVKDNDDITKLKEELIKKLRDLHGNKKFEYLINYKYDIQIILFTFKNKISKLHDKNDILFSYQQTFNETINKFIELKDDFFKENEIIENETIKNEIKEAINRKVNLDVFFKILLTIKNKYGKKEILKTKIRNDLREYQDRSGYDILKNNIESIINENYKLIKNNKLTSYRELLNKIKMCIDNLFSTYYNLLSEVDQLLCSFDFEEIQNDKANKLKEELKGIKTELINNSGIIDFAKIEDSINKIKIYKKEKKNFIIIDEAYKTILTKFNHAMLHLNCLNDLDKINLATKTFSKVVKLLNETKKGIISPEEFMQLSNLTFLDYEKDKELLNKINGHDNSCGIYVLKSYYNNFDDIILCKIVEETDSEVVFQGLTFLEMKKEKKLPQEQFDQMYIPLERILKNRLMYEEENTTSQIVVCVTDFIIFKLNIGLGVVRFEPNMESNKQNTSKKTNDNHKYFQDEHYLNDIINKIDLLLSKQKQKTIKL